MARSDLTFRIFGKDVTGSKALKGVGSTADRVGKGMGSKMGLAFAGIGTAAAAAGAMVAVDFGQKSVTAFIDAQGAQAKFEASLAKNNLGDYAGDIDALASALALKTRFDDDATKSGAAVLANFGLTGDQLKAVLPLVQDYAAFTGKDMPTASKTLGKAFLGNTKALKDLGIAYKPTGDKAKDMAAIMAEVNAKVGGFAEKEGKTAAGTAAILSNQFGEVQETIGSYLVPALTSIGQWIITNVIPAISKLVDWFKVNLLPVIQDVGGWIMNTFVPAVQDLAEAFMRDVWPAIQEVAGIVAENLQPAIQALVDLWNDHLGPAFQKALPYIQAWLKFVGILIGLVAVAVSWIIGKLVPAIAAWIGKITEISTRVREVVEGIRTKFSGIVTFIKGLPAKIALAAVGMWNGITSSFKGAINAIIGLWNNLSFSLPSVSVPGLGEVGGMTLDTPNIPMLAKGAYVTGPTLAVIGENGTETVVPYDMRKNADGGGTHLHFHGPVAGPGAGRWLADEIKKATASGRTRLA